MQRGNFCLLLFFGLVVCLFLGCEDAITVDAPAEEPRLVVDGIIRIDASKRRNDVAVRLGVTGSFFEFQPITSVDQIALTNSEAPGDTSVFPLFQFVPNSGIYQQNIRTDFFTEGNLVLSFLHEGKDYIARASYLSTVPIDSISQGSNFLTDEEETEVIVTFTDDGSSDDFYVFDFGFGEFFRIEDEFFQGEQHQFSYFYDRKLDPGDQITVSILAADQTFYDYISLIIEQSQESLGVFQTPVATVKGNIIDVTELDNIDVFDNVATPEKFVLGYFAVVQSFDKSLIIK